MTKNILINWTTYDGGPYPLAAGGLCGGADAWYPVGGSERPPPPPRGPSNL